MITLYKVANQHPSYRFNSGDPKPICGRCNKLLPRPEESNLYIGKLPIKFRYVVFHYVGTPHFILETKSGKAITYCSEYCMKKHHHLFRSKK